MRYVPDVIEDVPAAAFDPEPEIPPPCPERCKEDIQNYF